MKAPDTEARGLSLREQLRNQLDPAAQEQLSPVNKAIATLIVVSVGLGILGTEPAVQDAMGDWLLTIESALGAVFLCELVARLWIAGLDPRYTGVMGAVRYQLRPMPLIDLLVVATLILPTIGGELTVLRLLRILRIVALAKFGRYSVALQLLAEAVSRRHHELIMSVAVAGLVFLVSATGMYAIEGDIQPEVFGSIPRALWWSMATLTTVGYGDVYPVTPLGKVFGGLTALAGVGLIAMPAGILASAFSELAGRRSNESE